MSEKTKTTAAEVGVRLVLDSNAQRETDHIKDGLKKLDGQTEKTAKSWKQKLGSAVSMAGGFAVSAATATAAAAFAAGAGIIGLAHHSAEAFMESEEQVRGLAGTLTLIDQSGNAFEDLSEYAGELKDGLEDVAMQAGVTDDAMVAVFNDIIERGGKGVDQAKELAEQMAFAGRAIPGGAESLSAGFEAIQMGMVRAKNPIVQLIASTHTLKGSAKSVAKEMQKMSIDEQMELAEKAIGKMSTKMKDAPMTIDQMKTSMGVAWGNLFEEAGAPITAALGPIVGKIRGLFLDNSGALQKGAKAFGQMMAQGLDLVIPMVDALTKAIKASWGDIQKVIDQMNKETKETLDYLTKNKDAIATTLVGAAEALIKAGTFLAGPVVNAVRTVKDLFVGVVKLADRVLPGGNKIGQYLVDEAQGSAGGKLRGKVQAQNTRGYAMSESYKGDLQKDFVAEMVAAGASVQDAEAAFTASFHRATQDHNRVMDNVAKYREAAVMADSSSFAKAWAIADKSNDEGAKEYVANFLAANKFLVKEMTEKGPEILGEGFGHLVQKLEGMKSTIADDLKSKRPDLGIAGKANITQNFTGGITIKQDFRDQDPDRVVTVMRDELARAGSSRLQSSFAGAFSF
jgi:hypothetical protein